MPNLDIISINIWQILISLCNLLIIFLIVKKFLFGPIRKVIAQRTEKIETDYATAAEAAAKAQADQQELEAQLAAARTTADDIIKSATQDAQRRSETMLEEARTKADGIVRRAEEDAAREHKKAQSQIKHEIADVSVLLTQKMLDREINADDHRELIDSFIETIGDE